MRKLLSYFIILLVGITLYGCSDDNEKEIIIPGQEEETESPKEEEPEEEMPPLYLEYEAEFPEAFATGLPVVILNTPDGKRITSKEIWLEGADMLIFDENREVDFEGTLSVKGRGNTTWQLYPKKPYALKLDSKSKILGMKKHKRWCLLANYLDRTLIRNAVAFEISRSTGLPYTPSGKFVELILNGEHLGNYYLTEQIKVDENRVDIAELVDDGSLESLTGGYIFELDTYFDELNKFYSSIFSLPWQFKDPDEVTIDQINYIKDYVYLLEESLLGQNLTNREYLNYLDVDSFIDYWFVYELSTNREPMHPKSVYMIKDKNGKMMAGPVWDFDWETFAPSLSRSYSVKDAVYYKSLFKDPEFKAEVKERWNMLKSDFELISGYIDSLAEQVRLSNELNFTIWGCPVDVNSDYQMDYDSSIELLRKAYDDKLDWLDSQISNY